jgi:hypothetical protein
MTHTTHLLDPKRGRASAYRKWTLCGEQVRTALVFLREEHHRYVAGKLEITCRVCLLAEAVPELRTALESAIDTIRIWHGAAFVGSAIADPNRNLYKNLYKKAWEHYRTTTPEMKLLYAALEKTAAATALAPAVPPASLAQKQKGEKS